MKNDLSKLSDAELKAKIRDIINAGQFAHIQLTDANNEYNKLIRKRRVTPEKLLMVKNRVEKLQLSEELLGEYSKTIVDEQNRRIEEAEKEVEEDAYTTTVDKYRNEIRGAFKGKHPDHWITKGIDIAETHYPNRKLQAVKEFKDFSNLGLKESKAIMDVCWEEISFAHSIKGPTA